MLDHLRRIVAVVLTALVLLAVPQIAHATFTGRAAPQLSVGTAELTAPYDVAGTRTCNNRGINLVIDGFAFDGPSGVTYRYSIFRGSATTATVTQTSSARSQSISTGRVGGAAITWRVTIRAELAGWTGDEWTRSYTC